MRNGRCGPEPPLTDTSMPHCSLTRPAMRCRRTIRDWGVAGLRTFQPTGCSMPSVQATAATGSQERRPRGAALWRATAWLSGASAVARTGAMRGSVDLTFPSAMACPTHAKKPGVSGKSCRGTGFAAAWLGHWRDAEGLCCVASPSAQLRIISFKIEIGRCLACSLMFSVWTGLAATK